MKEVAMKTINRLAALIAVISIFIFLGVNPITAQLLGPEIRVTTNPAPSYTASLGIDSNGNVHIGWLDERDGNQEIYYKKLSNEGDFLTGDRRVTDDPAMSHPPENLRGLVIDSLGNVHIVWYDHRDYPWYPFRDRNEIYYEKLDNNGNSLTGNVRVTYDSANSIMPSLAVDASDNVHIVWSDRRAGRYEIYYRKMDNNGNFVGSVRKIGPFVNRDLYHPSIAIDEFGNIHVVWNAWDEDIYYRKLDNSGNPITEVKRVTFDPARSAIAVIDVDSAGGVHLAWQDDRVTPVGGPRIFGFFYKKLDNNGNPLTEDRFLGSTTTCCPSVSLDVDNVGNVHLAWPDDRDGNDEIYYIKLDNNGDPLTEEIRVTNDPAGSRGPSIGVDETGKAHISWVDNRDENPEIYYRSVTAGYISHIEVTQATQDENNSVPLIADKPTFVRVYVDCGEGCTSLPNVTGVLRGYGPSGELEGSPLQPVNRSITARHEDWRIQRGDLKKTLNFILPWWWCTGTVTLTAEVNGATHSETITFRSARVLDIIYVPINYRGQSPVPYRIQDGAWWAYRVYPTGRMTYIPGTTLNWNLCLERSPQCPRYRNATRLLNELTTRYRLVGDYVYGWLPEWTYGGGRADPEWYGGAGRAAFGDDNPTEGRRIFAHEIAHLMGRRHTNTQDNVNHPEDCVLQDPGECNGDPDCIAVVDTDSDWVREDGLPGPPPFPDSRIQDYGLDGSDWQVKEPDETYDYMSYCGDLSFGNVWTSPWTYEHIYSETLSTQATALALQPLSTPQPYFIASGLVYTDDTATLDPIWVITTTVTPKNPPEGTQYCLEAQDASGVALVSRCFDLKFVNYETGEATNVDGFNLMLPYPSNVARIVLKKETREIAVQPVSANAPIVTVLSPNGGESWSTTGTYTITWSASDADGDSLTYSVLYSPDGSKWVPVGSIITQTQLAVNAEELAGSTNALIRVMASDGVNTSSDESDGVFTVGRKPPSAYILSPESGITIQPNTPLLLQGYAYDLEDGVLEEGALQWLSNIDGALGSGSYVLVILSSGQHIITFTAQDSDGNFGEAQISVYVGHKIYLPIVLKNW
jgi:hypothetical protein